MIITILSDLGLRDTQVASLKASILKHTPATPVVDISHAVAQYDLQQAAYLLLCSYPWFPKHSVHIVAVDIFADKAARTVAIEYNDHFFIAPDNGILPLAFRSKTGDYRLCFELNKPLRFADWTDLAGKAAAEMIANKNISHLQPYNIVNAPTPVPPQATPLGIDCRVLYIDRFGNVVLDITKAQFEELIGDKPFRIKVMRMQDISNISNNYSDVKEGEPLCRFNRAGFLEVAVNRQSAASLFGLESYSSASLKYRTIKLFI
jgi:S-adenosylmethionine hydrolase